MALPVLETPKYTLIVPSTQKKVVFRPFFVKEEKILLIAMQENTPEASVNAIKDIIKNCTFGELDPDKLATYDLEYIFLQLSIKSKGKDSPIGFECDKDIPQERDILTRDPDGQITKKTEQFVGPCGHVTKVVVDLTTVQLQQNDKHANKIMFTDSIGFVMRSPTLDDAIRMQSVIDSEDVVKIYDAMNAFVETAFDGTTIYEFTPQELGEFIDNLPDEQFQKIKNFFDTMPRLKHTVKFKCEKCGDDKSVDLEGLQSFLVL